MLITHVAHRRSILRVALAVVLLAGTMAVFGQQQAQAAMCNPPYKIIDGQMDYGWCEDDESEDPPDDDGGGGSEPTCDYSLIDIDDYEKSWCEGEFACISTESGGDPPAGEKPPTEDSVWTWKHCYGPPGTEDYFDWYWEEPDEPSIEQQAWEAWGNLRIPAFDLKFNPPQRTYVTLETWWWAEGPGNGEITGTSAGPIVAIATPDRVEVDPGDGSGVISCGWVTSKSDDCTYTYKKSSASAAASASDGSPAYPARSRIVYDVRFENNGTVIEVPGLPTTLPSNWQETPVPVAEVQGIVTE